MNDNISEEIKIIDESNELLKEATLRKCELEDMKNSYKFIETMNINIPLDLKIEKYLYHYKYIKKITKEIIYRCKYATTCKVFISIDLENMKKIISKEYNGNEIIKYKYNNNNKHSCQDVKEIALKKNINTNDDNIKILIDIIKSNPLKTLNTIKLELQSKNITLNEITIKNYLEKIRNEYFIKDKEYINLIYKETINFVNNGLETIENFYYGSKNIYNKDKERLENYIILSSATQLKFLENTSQIFIDCTFKSAPKNFYQIMNILIKPADYDHIIPIIHVLMSNKSYYSYINIFSDIKLNLFIKKININWEKMYFIHDFEKGLVKAIGEYFPKSKSIGCYYHYCKSLWVYAKKHQCFQKKITWNYYFYYLHIKCIPLLKIKTYI